MDDYDYGDWDWDYSEDVITLDPYYTTPDSVDYDEGFRDDTVYLDPVSADDSEYQDWLASDESDDEFYDAGEDNFWESLDWANQIVYDVFQDIDFNSGGWPDLLSEEELKKAKSEQEKAKQTKPKTSQPTQPKTPGPTPGISSGGSSKPPDLSQLTKQFTDLFKGLTSLFQKQTSANQPTTSQPTQQGNINQDSLNTVAMIGVVSLLGFAIYKKLSK